MSPTKWQTQPKYRFHTNEPLTSRIRHSVLTMTHVVVGDHDPEPRGGPYSHERYDASKARPSKGLHDDADYVSRRVF